MSTALGSKPSICFVNTGPAMPGFFAEEAPAQVGGVELQLHYLSTELQARGWQTSFVLGDYGQHTPLTSPEGIRLLVGHAPHTHPGLLGFLLYGLRPLWRALDEANADIYFQHGIGILTGLLAFYARRRGKKFVFAAGSTVDLLCDVGGASRLPHSQRWTAAYGLRHADLLLVQSEEQQRIAGDHWRRQAPIMRNVWPGPFGPAEEEREDVVLWVGGMRPVKRPELVLELAKLLPDVRFVVVGGPSGKHGALFETIRIQAQSLPNVRIMGFVPIAEVDRYFREAALLLNTSSVEGFPNAFLHAWGRYKPVVAMYDPNHLLRERGFGRCADSLEELAAAIRELCADRQRRQKIGAAAAEYVKQHHAPQRVIAALEVDLLHLISPATGSTTSELIRQRTAL